MRALVTGGAGAIGSHLVERLVEDGHDVTVYDNLSAVGACGYSAVQNLYRAGAVQVILGSKADVENAWVLSMAMRKCDTVFHLAADGVIAPAAGARTAQSNTDVSPARYADLQSAAGSVRTAQFDTNVSGTFRVLTEAARSGVSCVVFTSSATVYGMNTGCPNTEATASLHPVSLYGATKVAGEALCAAFAAQHDLRVCIFRLGNVVGPRATHGVHYDLLRKLRDNPRRVEVLGNGEQRKPFLHWSDCISGMICGLEAARAVDRHLSVYNIAPEGNTKIRDVAEMCRAASPHKDAELVYGTTPGGWEGDVPVVSLDASLLGATGWKRRYSSDEAAKLAAEELAAEVFGGEASAV